MSTSVAPLEMVDTDRYPLTDPDSPAWRETVGRTRADLADVGCSVLADFIRPGLQEALRAECAALEPHAYTKIEKVNAYNTAIGEPLPEDHPGRTIMERGNAFVARDRIPASAIIARLYTSPLFQRFVADCFGLPELHELADPLSGLTLNVIAPGRAHPWHFDTNSYTVSMLTQAAEVGGTFEYCPSIRSAADENFAAVRSVLAGRRHPSGPAARPPSGGSPALPRALRLAPGQYGGGCDRAAFRDLRLQRAPGRRRQRGADQAAVRPGPARTPRRAHRARRRAARLDQEPGPCLSTRPARSRSTTSTLRPTRGRSSARCAASTTKSRSWRSRTSPR